MAAITPWGFDPDALAATYGRTPSLPDTLRLASQDWGICPETIRLILAHSALETTQDGLEGCPATGRVSIPRSTASLKMKLSGREGGPRHGRDVANTHAGVSARNVGRRLGASRSNALSIWRDFGSSLRSLDEVRPVPFRETPREQANPRARSNSCGLIA